MGSRDRITKLQFVHFFKFSALRSLCARGSLRLRLVKLQVQAMTGTTFPTCSTGVSLGSPGFRGPSYISQARDRVAMWAERKGKFPRTAEKIVFFALMRPNFVTEIGKSPTNISRLLRISSPIRRLIFDAEVKFSAQSVYG